MGTFEITINPELCTGCCNCVLVCPVNLEIEPICAEGIAPKTNDVILRVINGFCRVLNPDKCLLHTGDCGKCELVCPNAALQIEMLKKEING